MESRVDYNQILKMIHQLPPREIEMLTQTLQMEMTTKQSSESLQKIILDAPTWTDSDIHDYEEARKHINKSRIA
jgi:hypothetical protein